MRFLLQQRERIQHRFGRILARHFDFVGRPHWQFKPNEERNALVRLIERVEDIQFATPGDAPGQASNLLLNDNCIGRCTTRVVTQMQETTVDCAMFKSGDSCPATSLTTSTRHSSVG